MGRPPRSGMEAIAGAEGIGPAMVSRATFEGASSRLTRRQVPHNRSQGPSQLIGPRQGVLSHIPHHLENTKCLAPAQRTRDRHDRADGPRRVIPAVHVQSERPTGSAAASQRRAPVRSEASPDRQERRVETCFRAPLM
jgi:hypothetical protein